MSMRGSPTKKLSVMERRVPKNSKYEGVSAVVDSGPTTRKVAMITTREYLKRRDELFRRVRPLALYHLLVDNEEAVESIYDIPEKEEEKSERPATVAVVHDADEVVEVDKPYLLLDVREEAEYDACHLMEARSFPASKISQDRVTPEMFRYKNKEDRIIILYDADERIAAPAAALMVQKGWENVYLLTGGLKVAAAKFPLLVDGVLPDALKMEPPKTGASRMSSSRSTAWGGSVAGSVVGGGMTSRSSVGRRSARGGAGSASVSGRSYR